MKHIWLDELGFPIEFFYSRKLYCLPKRIVRDVRQIDFFDPAAQRSNCCQTF